MIRREQRELKPEPRTTNNGCSCVDPAAPSIIGGAMTSTSVSKPKLREKAQIMSASEIERTLVRLAHEIIEKNDGIRDLVLIGIKRRGVPIAERIGKIIQRIEGTPVPVGVLDIQFYRDDLSTVGEKPLVTKSDLGVDVDGKDRKSVV